MRLPGRSPFVSPNISCRTPWQGSKVEFNRAPHSKWYNFRVSLLEVLQIRSAVLSTVREITYEVLRKLGMTVIFGNPGSTELPFLRDMPADFRYVLGLHERSAAGMALGYAMAKGTAVFVNLHSIATA